MNEFLAQYGRYLWLAGSLLMVILVDYGVTRLMLEFVRPASSSAFWAGRVGKLAGLVAWVGFFNTFWYPTYMAPAAFGDQPVEIPEMIRWAETGVFVALLVIAAVTLPRGARVRGEVDA